MYVSVQAQECAKEESIRFLHAIWNVHLCVCAAVCKDNSARVPSSLSPPALEWFTIAWLCKLTRKKKKKKHANDQLSLYDGSNLQLIWHMRSEHWGLVRTDLFTHLQQNLTSHKLLTETVARVLRWWIYSSHRHRLYVALYSPECTVKYVRKINLSIQLFFRQHTINIKHDQSSLIYQQMTLMNRLF